MKKNNRFILTLVMIFAATAIIAFAAIQATTLMHASLQTSSVAVDPVASIISAQGTIHSQNEATLYFQTGGKLVYLPYQEGDKVSQGATVARLDTYSLQKTLQLDANAYQITKNGTDQTQENNQAGVVEGQQRVALDKSTTNSYNNITEAQIVTDTVQRFVDNSLLSQNSAQLNVDLANYAIQLASLTAPFNGIITHEDVKVANQNVGPTTGFSIADPTNLVFRANLAPSDIDFVSVGSSATIQLDGQRQTYTGIVTKIYPSKTTLSDGEQVYQVDIQSDELDAKAQTMPSLLSQSGSVNIQSNTTQNVTLVPTWTILNHNYVWVMENNKQVLKQVSVGKTHGQNIEITSGLSTGDRVITDPKGIAQENYQLL